MEAGPAPGQPSRGHAGARSLTWPALCVQVGQRLSVLEHLGPAGPHTAVNRKKMQLPTVPGLPSPNSMSTPTVPWDAGADISPRAPPGDLVGPLGAVGPSLLTPVAFSPAPAAASSQCRKVWSSHRSHGGGQCVLPWGTTEPHPTAATGAHLPASGRWFRGDAHAQAQRDGSQPPLRHKARETISKVHLLQHPARSTDQPQVTGGPIIGMRGVPVGTPLLVVA